MVLEDAGRELIESCQRGERDSAMLRWLGGDENGPGVSWFLAKQTNCS
jgi:hypothetical protein